MRRWPPASHGGALPRNRSGDTSVLDSQPPGVWSVDFRCPGHPVWGILDSGTVAPAGEHSRRRGWAGKKTRVPDTRARGLPSGMTFLPTPWLTARVKLHPSASPVGGCSMALGLPSWSARGSWAGPPGATLSTPEAGSPAPGPRQSVRSSAHSTASRQESL